MIIFILLAFLAFYYYIFNNKLSSENKAIIIFLMFILIEIKAIILSSWFLAFLGLSILGLSFLERV